VFRFDGSTWQRVYEISQRVCDIAFAAEDTPWIGTCGTTHSETGALFYRQNDTWVDPLATLGLVNAPVQAIAPGPDGMLAAGTDRGIGIYQGGTWRWLRGGPIRSQVTTLAVTPDGAAWLGFGDSSSYYSPGSGLSRFDGQNWEYSLEGSSAQVLTVAPDGALWAAAGCMVRRFDGQAWQTLADCQPLKSFITDITFTPGGVAWAAGGGMGLARFDGEGWTSYDKLAIFLAVAPDGTLWITGWEGLQSSSYVAHFDGKEWTTYYTDELFQDSLARIAVTPDGSLWGSTTQHGLARFDGQAWTFHSLPDGLPADISALSVAPDGAVWIGTGKGAARLADPASGTAGKEAWIIYTSADGLADDNVRAIAFAPDGAVWFGTADGASRFQPAPDK
jgi:ligand-binding sensor domain-containing protein